GLFGFVLGVGVCIATLMYMNHRPMYSADTEHESAFLRNYGGSSARAAINPFAFEDDPIGIGEGLGSTSGRHFVTYKQTINPMFSVRADMRLPLMNALSEDLAAKLANNGAAIIARSGDAQKGFRLLYRDGTSVGSVMLLPLEERQRLSGNPPLP